MENSPNENSIAHNTPQENHMPPAQETHTPPTPPSPEDMQGSENKGGSGSAGSVIGIIIIVLVIIVGGLYFWGQRLSTTGDESVGVEELSDAQAAQEVGNPVDTSDEITAIEDDLNTTDLENLDSEIGDIEAELDGLAL